MIGRGRVASLAGLWLLAACGPSTPEAWRAEGERLQEAGDDEAAAAAFVEACRGGDNDACSLRWPMPVGPVDAARFAMERACEAADAAACAARAPIVLAWAARSGPYRHDPVISQRQSRSILCVPVIRREQLMGLVYLENDLVTDAFGPERSRAAQVLAAQIGMEDFIVTLWTILRWPVIILLLMISVATMYYVMPDVKQEFRFISPGSVLAVVVWILASLGFAYYVKTFANYDAMYGSIGAIIVLLLYFYISASVLLLGAEMNAVIEHMSEEGKDKGEKVAGDGGKDADPEVAYEKKHVSGLGRDHSHDHDDEHAHDYEPALQPLPPLKTDKS